MAIQWLISRDFDNKVVRSGSKCLKIEKASIGDLFFSLGARYTTSPERFLILRKSAVIKSTSLSTS